MEAWNPFPQKEYLEVRFSCANSVMILPQRDCIGLSYNLLVHKKKKKKNHLLGVAILSKVRTYDQAPAEAPYKSFLNKHQIQADPTAS